MIRFSRFLLITALMISIGGQWAVLQSIAWVGMAVSYSIREGSVTVGLSQTFDGDHPCKLCCAIEKGKDAEKKDPKQQEKKVKLELFVNQPQALVIGVFLVMVLPGAADEAACQLAAEPPCQPPRAA